MSGVYTDVMPHNKKNTSSMIDENSFVKYIHEQLGLPIPLAESIVSYFDYKIIPKNTLILKAGEICENHMFIHEGIMRSYILDDEGKEITTNFHTKNQVAIEQASFFNRSLSCENIQTLTDCTLWKIDFEKFQELFHSIEGMREWGRAWFTFQLFQSRYQKIEMITETAKERYLKLLKEKPQIIQQAPLKQIATYLGITDTSLSRIRKEISEK